MTAADEPRRVVHDGAGTTGPFAFDFEVLNVDEIRVQVTRVSTLVDDLVLNAAVDGFTVSFAAPPATGGTITTTEAVEVGDVLVVYADTGFEQGTVYPEGSTFPAKTIETDFDRRSLVDQQLRDDILRAVQLPLTYEGGQPLAFPDPADGIGLFIRANATGDGYELASLTGSGTIAIPVAVLEGGTGGTTAAAARANLAVLEDVLTTQGDLLIEGISGPERLAIGSRGLVPISTGSSLIYSNLPGFIQGLRLANDTTDPLNDIVIGVGAAAEDSGHAVMRLGSEFIKRLDNTWVVGTNQGMLDTGAVAASTLYYIFLIQRSDTGIVDVLASANLATPTLPTNYDRKRLIGYIRTNPESTIEAFTWNENGEYEFGDFDETAGGNISSRLYAGVPPLVTSITGRVRVSGTVTNSPGIQIGPVGGVEVASYGGISSILSGGSTTGTSFSTTFRFSNTGNFAAADVGVGSWQLRLVDAAVDRWAFNAHIGEEGGLGAYLSVGGKTLGGSLERFQFLASSGDFDILEHRFVFHGYNPRSLA